MWITRRWAALDAAEEAWISRGRITTTPPALTTQLTELPIRSCSVI